MNDEFDSIDELDGEGPQSVDIDELGHDAESETLPCPSCGVDVYEDTDRCPACGEYITPRWATSSAQPIWWSLAIFVAIAAVIYITAC